MSTPIQTSEQLIQHAIDIAAAGRRPVVAVAAAQDADVLQAVVRAEEDGFLEGILVGDVEKIKHLADEGGFSLDKLTLVDSPDIQESANKAVGIAADGSADAVMKGFLPTSTLLKTVLSERYRLRNDNTLSHCALLDIPGYPRLLNVTDGGVVVKPDAGQKYQILENAVNVGRAIGLSTIKVAVSAATDRLSERMPHTLSDLDTLIPTARERLKDVIIQGPISFDVAVSREAAEYHGVSSSVAGEADVYLVDSIEEGNLISKTLINLAGATFCGVIVGARVPVALVSRTDSARNKTASLAATCVVADYYRRSGLRGEY